MNTFQFKHIATLLLFIAGFNLSSLAQETAPQNITLGGKYNVIKSYDAYKSGLTSTTVLLSTNPFDVGMSAQYLDGLGRPIQTIMRKLLQIKETWCS